MNKGFSLAEILVVIAIMAIAGTMLVAIFSSTLRGSNKSQILASIKQNGQAALDKIDKTIRNSDNVVCVTPDKKTLVVEKNGTYSRFRFIAPGSDNGLIKQDNPVQSSTQTLIAFTNQICLDADPLTTVPPSIVLTDTNSQSGVSVNCFGATPDCTTNPIFSRSSAAGFKDQVTVRFNLWPGVGAPSAVAGQIDPVTFQTTIQLR